MRVVVTGGTGVLGRASVQALVEADHDVVVACRRPGNHAVARNLGAGSVDASIFDVDALTTAYERADAVVNLATGVPMGYLGALSRAWHTHDRIHTEGVANVVEAARRTGVRRVVQESMTSVYADQGDEWITESSPVEITACVEPVAVAESQVQAYSCDSRSGVVLRFGHVVGDDPMTRYWLRAAAHGRPVGIGQPDQWAHLIHTDDVGSAVTAALVAPAGCYNVGALPVPKADLVAAYAEATGCPETGFMGPVLRWTAGSRLEPLARSLRVCSEHFSAQTGWRPSRQVFDVNWLWSAALSEVRS